MCREHKTPETIKRAALTKATVATSFYLLQLIYREALREVEAVRFRGCRHGGVCLTVGGAEKPRLMKVQLLQLLWVLRQCCREQ